MWIEPGSTSKPLELDDPSDKNASDLTFEPVGELPEVPPELKAAVAKDQLDHDGNGKPGGSRRGAQSTRAKGTARRRTLSVKTGDA